ncbi:MAG: ThiF family adenylyltransferase, partial [Bacteroidia bacterium]
AVWELGTGIYREMDIILGCLDNIETRIAVNRNCWLAERPWIDAGIKELGCRINFYQPPYAPCYECGVSRENLKLEMLQRYSCDNFKKKAQEEGKVATVQIASSLVAALQVQEVVKYLCGEKVEQGKQIYYQGKFHDFDINTISEKATCYTHTLSYPEIIEIPLGSHTKLKDFLKFVSSNEFSGENATLDFAGDIMSFVKSVACRYCNNSIKIMRPNFQVDADETICPSCKDTGATFETTDTQVESLKEIISQFNLEATSIDILEMTLSEIGIPLLHIVAVHDELVNYKYYQLSGDKEVIFPNLFRRVE